MTNARVRFSVLRGAVSATADGEAVALGGPQQRRVLAALLAEPGAVVSADRLVEYLWSDDRAPDQARRTVMSYISRLRSAVGADHVVLDNNGYRLVLDGASCDATDFEFALADARAAEPEDAVAAYERALDLWTGRAFGDDADEWWLRPVAARLEELRLLALEERAESVIDDGRHADAVADLERLVGEHPLRERFVELLMRALYFGGRQAEALRAFRAFADYLAEETGLPPSDALIELEHRITLGDPTLAPATGLAVPGYELGDLIGEGAFGSVYRAVQPSVGREVAVKVVRAELADDPRFVQRFEAEAQLVARLEHPHVVPLYDFWRRPGGAFLVFRLLRGGSLADRLGGGRVSIEEATQLVSEISGALSAAHALGVVHRDVKPANVLFDEAGNSYLADFGISVLADDELTLDLRSAGSPLYASPEQVRDSAATAASDQYSLAVVVWEALAGRAPFSGSSTTAVLQTKLTATVPALSEHVAVPKALDAVLERATAPHPSDRYPTVVDFAHAWQLALSGSPADALRTTGGTGGPATRTVSSTVASMPAVGANPYKGLRAFREADAADFRGRDDLVARLVDAVSDSPFVTVVGPSGSGKSSLVHAGVVPEFRRRGALVVSMVPGVAPMAELETALRRVATKADEAAISQRLNTPGGLTAIASELVEDGEQIVLVVDQFEELWTLVESETERDRFAALLEHAANADQAALRIVVTLRADLYDRPLQDATLGPVVSRSTFAVTPMTATELQDAIVGPAERAGVRFEPGLVAAMINDVVHRPGALPLLQFALTELYERRDNATVTTAAYEQLGGIGGALASRAEQLYADLRPEQRSGVRLLFTQLVSPGDDNDDLRRRATTAELAGVPAEVIEQYRSNRLLVTDHHPITREPTIEVAHEALLREWPRLAEWIDEDRDAIRLRRLIAQTADEWQGTDRDESLLYRGPRLAAAADVAAHMPLLPTEREFLAASHELADRERSDAERRAQLQARQNRRLRGLLTATAIVLVIAMVFGVFAVTQRNNARDQQARANENAELADANAAEAKANADTARQELLISQSQSVLATDKQLGALLAVEADLQAQTAGSRDALLSAVMAEPRIQQTFAGPTGFLATLVDHRVIVNNREVDALPTWGVYDWQTGARLPWPESSPYPDEPTSIVSSRDGTVLAMVDPDGQAWTYSAATLEPLAPPFDTGLRPDENGGWLSALLDGDGDVLVVLGPRRANGEGRGGFAVFRREADAWVRGQAPVFADTHNLPRTFDLSADGTVIASLAAESIAEGEDHDDLMIHELATSRELWNFKVSAAYEVKLDWGRRRVVVSREILGAPGDISWYDLTSPTPAEQIIDLGLSPIGSADLIYERDYTRLGVNGNAGFQAFDAATMTPAPGIAVVNTGTQQGPVRFLTPDQVLLATVGAGPVSRWDLTGTPSLATPIPERFDAFVTGGPQGTSIGVRRDDTNVTFTKLDDTWRPLGPAVAVRDAEDFPRPPVAGLNRVAACLDPGTGRVAIVEDDGDVIIRAADAPYEVLSRAPRALGGSRPAYQCAWRPDGRQIVVASGLGSDNEQTLRLWDVTAQKVQFERTVPGTAILATIYRADSEVLWFGGDSGSVSEVSDLDGKPRVRVALPDAGALTVDDRGRLIAVTRNTIQRYDPETYDPLGPPIDVRSDFVLWLSAMPDGSEVAVSSITGWRLVDLDAERTLGPKLPELQRPAELAGAGPIALLLNTDGRSIRWNLSPERVREAACSLAGRNLTAEEWDRYLSDAGERRATCSQYPL